jgi:putative serine protease PepD
MNDNPADRSADNPDATDARDAATASDATTAQTPDVTTPQTPAAAAPQAPAAPNSAPPLPPAPAAAWQPPRPDYPASQHPKDAPTAAYAGGPVGAAFGPAATQPTTPFEHPHTAQAAPAAPARKKSGAGRVVGLIVAAALVGGAAGLGGAYAGVTLWGDSTSSPAAGPATVTVNNPDDVNQTTAIAARVVPSVVTISASGESGAGTGSGVILSADGYVVTNTHVVTLDGQTGDATITATTSDGRVYNAEIVGTDPTYDLAVIRLEGAENLTPIEFADSSQLNVGDTTVAVGAPLGLSNTVTTGIVSALNRSIEVASSAAPDNSGDDAEQGPQQGEGPFFFDFGQGQQQPSQSSESISISVIQTDAAINPGNSGGALVDDQGRLIGINVAIASAGGSSGQAGSIGVGFAIPSDIAQRVANEIIDTGSATHGLLGASVRPAAGTDGIDIAGAYIAEVTPDGAAAAAGLREGDVVTEFNGVPITNAVDLTAAVRALAADAQASLTYVRDGQSDTVEVTLGTLG